LTFKTELIKKTTEGFLWSQKGKRTAEHKKEIINTSFQSEKKTEKGPKDPKGHLPKLKWEDCGSSEVPRYTLGLHVANA